MAAKSDKLFKRRRDLTKEKLKRRKANRNPQKRILIVSEGEITEPSYFESFKTLAGLVNVDVDVCGKECDSAPTSVVRFAERKANSEGHYKSGGYDEVYCVFDRDTHQDFDRAISKIFSLNKSTSFLAGRIEAVPSYPSFEIWLLFHFSYTRAPFTGSGDCSPAAQAAAALRRASPMFSDYSKALSPKQCEQLFGLLATATAHANRAQARCGKDGRIQPLNTNTYYDRPPTRSKFNNNDQ